MEGVENIGTYFKEFNKTLAMCHIHQGNMNSNPAVVMVINLGFFTIVLVRIKPLPLL